MRDYLATEFKICGDGQTDNTVAINQLINQCSEGGGGTIYFPAGKYLTGPIKLASYLTIYLAAGAVLFFDDQFDRYTPEKTRWSGYNCYGFSPLLFGSELEHVAIKGEGTIDGQGKRWWAINHQLKQGLPFETAVTRSLKKLNAHLTEAENTNLVEWDSQFLRPALLQLFKCRHVKLEGITLQHSPFWNTHLVYCDNVTIHDLTILNPADTPNGDGLDLDSCQHVRVANCHFDVGDDCIAIKSGINEDGRQTAVPSQNITITNCSMLHGHGGVVLGSEHSGGIKNVVISNCIFTGTDRGIRFKTNRERGGYIKQVIASDIIVEDCLCPIAINAFYRYGISEHNTLASEDRWLPVTEKTPVISDIKISNLIGRNIVAAAGFIYGLPEMPIRNLQLTNIDIEMNSENQVGGEPDMVKEELFMSGAGVFAKYVENLTCSSMRIQTNESVALTAKSCNQLLIDNLETPLNQDHLPVVELEDVDTYTIVGRQYDQRGVNYLATQ
ncbi:Polygalacturonase [Amphibacillus marinus]|uniref:Polygalacturonase n=1 Tax=Amphibacillus marinus TaxID=872970 RepID=A0A1H8HAA6_9BACI|nr:glycoside hydrolase family 28 protein [Amphibacillus marinus]SEN53261.1 Polygalacturonase [Amphibacillus marinus]